MFDLKCFSMPIFQNMRIDIIKKDITIVTIVIINTFLIISTATAQEQASKPRKSGSQSSVTKNKEMVVKIFQEVINNRNISYIDEVYVTNVIDRSAFPGQAPGTVGLKEAVNGFYETFSDLKVTVEDVIAEGNKVATRETWKGTKKSNGKVGSGTVLHIFWIQEGKVTEEWSTGWDWIDKL